MEGKKDPRAIARKYQLDLCKKAVNENIIVYLGTGCGKTHIAVLLMYELGHLIRLPSRNVCVLLAPTVPLVRQQAMVIESSTDFKVRSYSGNHKNTKDHGEWYKEIEQYEVLVMTPQILLHNLRHCFIKMDLIALLVFDECHHAQVDKRHPYAQIMKEFYKSSDTKKSPRIFGMTASPIIGKGGSDQLKYTRCINSLEKLLDSKVCSVDEDLELDGFVASPDMKVYAYDSSVINSAYNGKLEDLRLQCLCMVKEEVADSKDRQKKIKHLWRLHSNLIFCLEKIGLWGAMLAAQILLSSEGFDSMDMETDDSNNDNFVNQYLRKAASVLSCNTLCGDIGSDSLALETLDDPFISKKLLVLIAILSSYRSKEKMKCIIFVKRIIAARTLGYILGKIKALDFWKCEVLVGFHSGLKSMSRKKMSTIVGKFSSGQVNLLVATNVAEEGLDIQTCCLVVRFDLPETVASFIQSRGRARAAKSEYVFLVERGNLCEEKLLNDFMSGEKIMNKEIVSRSSTDISGDLEEKIYKVYSTGASISTGCSVSLLYRYCDKLPHDMYFTPLPKFFYIDGITGVVCRIILPPNVPVRQVDSPPCSSKDEAKRLACLKACIELHARGSLTDYLLPGLDDGKKKGVVDSAGCGRSEDDFLKEELHEMLIPVTLRTPWTLFDTHVLFYFYHIRFVPVPEDRLYRKFGLFMKTPLPEEAEAMEVDLHLAHGRFVKTSFVPSGMIKLDKEEVMLAQNFQEMSLKIILDRSEFFVDFVPLAKFDDAQQSSSTFYLLLPVIEDIHGKNMNIDWTTVRRSLSSPVFGVPNDHLGRGFIPVEDTVLLLNGAFKKCDILGSLVFTPHNKLFFFIEGIIDGIDASSPHKGSGASSYAEYYLQRFNIQLNHPHQPFLKAKQLFSLRNLLHNRIQETTEVRKLSEHFVELPPELCSLKLIGFSKDIGSSLSLLPSLMHRLENLLVAAELKDVLSASFPEASEIRAGCILEALTTEKCLERLSLERFEVLGDAFLKYVVGRHSFLSYEGLDEGQLTKKRSSIVNNSHLYELAIRSKLQVYIRDALFEPSDFFALGRPCKVVCNVDNESIIHSQRGKDPVDGSDKSNVKCTKNHQWLHRKTIADVVEALVGVFLVESGFKAAIAFLRWIGVEVDFEVRDIHKLCKESADNMSLIAHVDVATLEALIGYRFQHRGLLLQALIHPSYNNHSGGCYQKLEFLGDAVLEYLITSYLYSVYPDLKPGQITDLRSITVNNNSFAHIAVLQSLHPHLIKDSSSLTEAIRKFADFVHLSDSEKDLEEPTCPKVLGDMVESCIGAVLLDSGFNLNVVWKAVLSILEPALSFSSLQLNPIREIRELCQYCNFKLTFPAPIKVAGGFFVEVEVDVKGELLKFGAKNPNSKAARRSAAQDMIALLKARGYRHKSKTLEEIVRSTTKKEPRLIGYDEDAIVFDTVHLEKLVVGEPEGIVRSATKKEPRLVEYDEDAIVFDSVHLEKLVIGEPEGTCDSPLQREASASSNVNHKQFSAARKSVLIPHAECSQPSSSSQHQNGKFAGEHQMPNESANIITYQDTTGVSVKKTARSLLYETCASNYWSPPSFVLVKEEGLPHLRMFTYMVRVHVETISSNILECVSEPRPQRKAAQDHAAEGALWYLKHLGYLPEA